MSVGERYDKHVARCHVICDALGLPSAAGSAFVASMRQRFPDTAGGMRNTAAQRRRVGLLCQAFFGRLPRWDEFEAPTRFEAGEPGAVAGRLLAMPDHRRAAAALRGLSRPDPSALVVDISHTLRFHANGGIQRVVRSLILQLREMGVPHLFTRFCRHTHAYLPLDPNARERLSVPPPRRSAAARAASRAWAAIRRGGRPDGTTALFLWDRPLLIPELVAERERGDALCALLASAPLASTLVFYDAIPLRHPEFFDTGIRAGYASYLRLLRHVDGVSCISAAVADDVRTILRLVDRRGPPPVLTIHALGADFRVAVPPRDAGRPTVGETAADRPLVLCVGTIEPRKNQLRILDAMVRAQSLGSRFTGVFVGNAGWLNGAFREALARRIADGFSLELHENVDDGHLADFYTRAAFTVYCSIAEGFGLPIIESVMRRKVCVTSRRGSMQEVAERLGGCVLVDPDDTDDIAGAITRLLAEPGVLAAHQREADVAQWPGWADYAAELHRFCTTLAPGGARAAAEPLAA
jgi:glycosyltransferase involved in cell wall biosynthesis